MDLVRAKFVHDTAEFIREVQTGADGQPPVTCTLLLPGRGEQPARWPAVYVREPNPERDPQWIYRFRG